jgi:hypothetical protein
VYNKDDHRRSTSERECQFEQKYEATFQNLVLKNGFDNFELTSEEAYCARKYVVDNELMDPTYKLEVNPNAIDTISLNCEEIHAAILQKAEEGLFELNEILVRNFLQIEKSEKDKLDACLKDQITTNNKKFSDQFLQFEFLHEVQLDDTAKEKEKSKFFEFYRIFVVTYNDKCNFYSYVE